MGKDKYYTKKNSVVGSCCILNQEMTTLLSNHDIYDIQNPKRQHM